MHCREFFQETAPEQAREHAHRQEKAGPACDPPLAVRRQATTWDDAVHVRMVRQCRAPRMQHQRRADLRAQMLWIGGNGAQGFGGNMEQQALEHRLVVPGDRADRGGQCKDDMVVLDR